MNRWIARAAALYPRSWRQEYGEEFGAVLDDVKPRWRVFANVLGGAIRMQMTMGNNWLKLASATAACCAIMATGLSFTVTPQYVSAAVLSVMPQPDPLRPESPQALRQRAAQNVAEMEAVILSRSSLANIMQMPSLDLYPAEVKRLPTEDVIQKMRRNIRIQAQSSAEGGPIAFSISFSCPDQMKAQAAVRALATKFTEENSNRDRNRATLYRDFWQDWSIAYHAKPAPPPPVGDTVSVLDPPSPPKQSAGPDRVVFLAWGLGAGLLVGLLAALAMRRPRGVWHLGFAAAGCVLAGPASFLMPDRYTSTAIMMLTPAQLTEDPLVSPPAVTPAAEILRQLEPQVLSPQNLSRVIEDPRLNLYPAERARKPIEDVVRNMLARDLRIVPSERRGL